MYACRQLMRKKQRTSILINATHLCAQEVNILSSSMQSLKTVQLKLKESRESLESINKKNEGE